MAEIAGADDINSLDPAPLINILQSQILGTGPGVFRMGVQIANVWHLSFNQLFNFRLLLLQLFFCLGLHRYP